MGGKPRKPKRRASAQEQDIVTQPSYQYGDLWYLIPQQWWAQYLTKREMPPINARCLLDPNYNIQAISPHAFEHRDFELVHASTWHALVGEYGATTSICRQVMRCGAELKIELHPVILRTCVANIDTATPDWNLTKVLAFSSQTTLQEAVREIYRGSKAWRVWFRHNSPLREKARENVENWNDYKLVREDMISWTLAEFKFQPGSYMFVEVEPPKKTWLRGWLYRGAHIDCFDLTARWYPATVIDIKDDSVYVHYDHWAHSWDEWIGKSSPKLAPRGTHLPNDFGLIEAAANGQLDVVTWIVQDLHISPNVILPSGCGALTAAVYGGHLDVVRYLLSQGATVDTNEAQSRRGDERFVERKEWPPLFLAIERRQLPIVQCLIQYQASVNRVVDDMSPLLLACREGELNIAQYLVQRGSEVGLATHKWTPMVIAAAREQIAIMQWLVGSHGAQVNEVHRGASLLDRTIIERSPLSTQWLIKKGAAVNKCSQLLLREVIRQGKGNTLEVLLSAGLLIPHTAYEAYEQNVLTDAVNRIYARALDEGLFWWRGLNALILQYLVCTWEDALRILRPS